MRWRFISLIASLLVITVQSAQTQEAPVPTCAVACSVNPFTAPASCNCGATGGEAPADTPVPVETPTTPAAPVVAEPSDSAEQPAPVEPGVPTCQLACSVNPFTVPTGCDCNAPGGEAVTEAPLDPSPATAQPASDAARGPVSALRSWAAQPGETVRNSFGPAASDCRGACGPGCQSAQSCESGARYECLGDDRLLRIETYACRTHQGCRVHDDCLDRCAESNAQGVDCEAMCHLEAVQEYGVQDAMSWLQGGGPYDAGPIYFEYTSSAPGMPEPAYRCAEGTRLECGGAARCLTAAGVEVEPVFDAFPAGVGAISVSAFRSGRLCQQGPGGSMVCEQTVDIQVTGADSCAQGAGSARCTRFGFEFDYLSANPSVPLVCSAATSRGGTLDLPAFMLGQALSAVVSQEQNTDLGPGLRGLQDALRSGRSVEEVFSGVSVAPLDDNGRPVESQRVGAGPAAQNPPATPRQVSFEAASGHLVVPMYELHDPTRSGQVVEREVECSYNGTPVLETRFRLQFTGN